MTEQDYSNQSNTKVFLIIAVLFLIAAVIIFMIVSGKKKSSTGFAETDSNQSNQLLVSGNSGSIDNQNDRDLTVSSADSGKPSDNESKSSVFMSLDEIDQVDKKNASKGKEKVDVDSTLSTENKTTSYESEIIQSGGPEQSEFSGNTLEITTEKVAKEVLPLSDWWTGEIEVSFTPFAFESESGQNDKTYFNPTSIHEVYLHVKTKLSWEGQNSVTLTAGMPDAEPNFGLMIGDKFVPALGALSVKDDLFHRVDPISLTFHKGTSWNVFTVFLVDVFSIHEDIRLKLADQEGPEISIPEQTFFDSNDFEGEWIVSDKLIRPVHHHNWFAQNMIENDAQLMTITSSGINKIECYIPAVESVGIGRVSLDDPAVKVRMKNKAGKKQSIYLRMINDGDTLLMYIRKTKSYVMMFERVNQQ